tara:strand:+ start:971 stop:1513 length:543 start_codon:yes stop_codon:yes gene_type:complete
MSRKKNTAKDKGQSDKASKNKKDINTTDELVEKEAKVELSIEEQLAVEKDKNLRLFAEFENFRKRTAKERIELFSTANKDIMTVLLPILDNFERSIKANNYSDEDGPVLIFKQLKSELEKKGLSEIEDPLGKTLDTDFHEATAQVPAANDDQKGKIIDVIEKGYLLSGKILRYAKVVVGN